MRRRTLSERDALVLDVVIALVCAASGVWRDVVFPPGERRLLDLPVGVYAVVQVAGAATLVVRRRWPMAVGTINGALNLVTPTQASFVAAYTLGAHAARRARGIVTFALLLGGWCLGAQLWRLEDLVTGPVLLGLAGLFGLYVRARRTLYDALVERAERAEREQQHLARQAVIEERTRMASEMHDVVSHSVTLMVLQAGALAVSSPVPEVRRSAEDIRVRGVEALAELRDLIGLLRSDERGDTVRESAASPSASSLIELVDAASGGGLDVSLRERGPAAAVSPSVARAIHRITKEALTNAVKHAPGSQVDVDVAYGAIDTTVEIRNSPATTTSDLQLQRSGSGTGLHELRRQVEALGGSLRTRSVRGGGFSLRACVPSFSSSARSDVTSA